MDMKICVFVILICLGRRAEASVKDDSIDLDTIEGERHKVSEDITKLFGTINSLRNVSNEDINVIYDKYRRIEKKILTLEKELESNKTGVENKAQNLINQLEGIKTMILKGLSDLIADVGARDIKLRKEKHNSNRASMAASTYAAALSTAFANKAKTVEVDLQRDLETVGRQIKQLEISHQEIEMKV